MTMFAAWSMGVIKVLNSPAWSFVVVVGIVLKCEYFLVFCESLDQRSMGLGQQYPCGDCFLSEMKFSFVVGICDMRIPGLFLGRATGFFRGAAIAVKFFFFAAAAWPTQLSA